jgi:hypothetical protein
MEKIQPIFFRFAFAILGSALFALLSFFQWSIVDAITPFLLMPLWIFVGLIFLISVITSISCIWTYKRIKYYSLIPILINIIAFFIPYTNLWVTIDYYQHKKDREVIVAKIYQGELKPNVDYNSSLIALGTSYPSVSLGGNDIIVEEKEGYKYVFFFTYRGILDNYSGFIYVPDGGKPEMYSDLNESNVTQIIHYDGNWYWASHH